MLLTQQRGKLMALLLLPKKLLLRFKGCRKRLDRIRVVTNYD